LRAEGQAHAVSRAARVCLVFRRVIFLSLVDDEVALRGMLKPIYEEVELGRDRTTGGEGKRV
ncbi:hypothetical protein PJL71_29135, partial [Mycobacterium kansasii]